MKNITVIGGGVLGSQIAFQTAYCGFNTTISVKNEKEIEPLEKKLDVLLDNYKKAIKLMDKNKDNKDNLDAWCMGISDYNKFDKKTCLKNATNARKNITITYNMQDALKDADLVIESITENLEAKRNLFLNMANMLKKDTIVVTNSSTLLPSKMAKQTKREDRFLALHFANSIWKNNIAEVMRHDKTSDKSFNEVMKFAEEIRMIPIPVNKEKTGYVLNSMLIPLLFSALDLLVNNVSDVNSIDKTWIIGTGAKEGPFQILDVVGLKTAYNIVSMYASVPSFLAPYNFKGMQKLLKKYIDANKLGKETKEGFYKYK